MSILHTRPASREKTSDSSQERAPCLSRCKRTRNTRVSIGMHWCATGTWSRQLHLGILTLSVLCVARLVSTMRGPYYRAIANWLSHIQGLLGVPHAQCCSCICSSYCLKLGDCLRHNGMLHDFIFSLHQFCILRAVVHAAFVSAFRINLATGNTMTLF